jgi:hypothetical protein
MKKASVNPRLLESEGVLGIFQADRCPVASVVKAIGPKWPALQQKGKIACHIDS